MVYYYACFYFIFFCFIFGYNNTTLFCNIKIIWIKNVILIKKPFESIFIFQTDSSTLLIVNCQLLYPVHQFIQSRRQQ